MSPRVWGAGIGIVAVCGGLLAPTSGGLMLKFLLGKLIHSTSDGAALFLLAFSGAALACARRPAWGQAGLAIMSGLVLAFGVHLAITLDYFFVHDLPLSAHVWHWAEGVNSYTSLLHSHLGKVAMGSLIGGFGFASSYDTGKAFSDIAPWWASVMIGAGFVIALTGVLGGIPMFMARFGHRPWLVAAYLLAVANALKSIFDGGVLAYAVPPSLLLMASFHASVNETAWRRFWRVRGVSWGIALMATHIFIRLELAAPDEPPLFGPWLFFMAMLALLTLPAGRGALAGLTRAALLAYVVVNVAFDAGDHLAPLIETVDARHRAARFDATGQAREVAMTPYVGKPVFEIYRRLGEDPWKPRATLIWKHPAHGIDTLAGRLRLLAWQGESGDLTATPALQVTHLAPAGAGWLEIRLGGQPQAGLPPIRLADAGGALVKNNYYVWLYQADRLFRLSGWKSYIFLP